MTRREHISRKDMLSLEDNKKQSPKKQTGKNPPSLKGVFTALRKNGEVYFRSSLTERGKHISLGGFSTPEDAHAAYREGRRVLSDASCLPEHYPDSSPLPFEKWVSLANFRDNGIYFGTPIYMGQKMFYYYLSPVRVLKFDLDDLFYYSSHKIMCRGNHYFVADYGLQVSIASRYGIKPFAREDRDFRFINGDPTDFRRENLLILNTYHGVTIEQKNGQPIYAVRIHIKGNYLVGRYSSQLEAAIAYNKAIDILKKNGVAKGFTANYIEGLSPSKYAEIYTGLQISPKLTAYRP